MTSPARDTGFRLPSRNSCPYQPRAAWPRRLRSGIAAAALLAGLPAGARTPSLPLTRSRTCQPGSCWASRSPI